MFKDEENIQNIKDSEKVKMKQRAEQTKKIIELKKEIAKEISQKIKLRNFLWSKFWEIWIFRDFYVYASEPCILACSQDVARRETVIRSKQEQDKAREMDKHASSRSRSIELRKDKG